MCRSTVDRLRATGHQRGSSFLRVPGELRNVIYGYVFEGEVAHARPSYDDKHSWLYPTQLLSLTLTCRQMYHETKALPFTLGTFHGTPRTLVLGLQRTLTEAQSQAVTSICLQINGYALGSGLSWTFPNPDGIPTLLSGDCMHEETVFIADSIDEALRGLAAYPNIKHIRVECRSSSIYEEYGPAVEPSVLQCRERALVTEMTKRLCATDGNAGIDVEMVFPF